MTNLLLFITALLTSIIGNLIIIRLFPKYGEIIDYPLSFAIGFVVMFYGPRLLDWAFDDYDS